MLAMLVKVRHLSCLLDIKVVKVSVLHRLVVAVEVKLRILHRFEAPVRNVLMMDWSMLKE